MDRPHKYILIDKQPVPCDDLLAWARWYETADRHAGQTDILGVAVSTVFLGIDHNFSFSGQPILFETMVFGGAHDGDQERYCTWAEAEEGHLRWVEIVIGSETFPEYLKP